LDEAPPVTRDSIRSQGTWPSWGKYPDGPRNASLARPSLRGNVLNPEAGGMSGPRLEQPSSGQVERRRRRWPVARKGRLPWRADTDHQRLAGGGHQPNSLRFEGGDGCSSPWDARLVAERNLGLTSAGWRGEPNPRPGLRRTLGESPTIASGRIAVPWGWRHVRLPRLCAQLLAGLAGGGCARTHSPNPFAFRSALGRPPARLAGETPLHRMSLAWLDRSVETCCPSPGPLAC